MASPTVSQVLEIVNPETPVDDRIEALGHLSQEIACEDQRDRMEEILQAIKGSPHRSRRNGS
jgi:hypothetical protein